MPVATRFSLLVAAYPTITAALLFAFRRLQHPFLERLMAPQAPLFMIRPSSAAHNALAIASTSSSAAYSSAATAASASPSASSSTSFNYLVSSSFHAKNRGPPRRGKAASSRPDSGEDAFFISRIRDSESVALGVVDGVGGWNEIGIDATEFSHSLAESMADLASRLATTGSQEEYASSIVSKFSFPPLVLLDAAYNAIKAGGRVKAGGSTASVGVAHANGTLQAANLGDSGFFIFRDGHIHYMSDPQTHFFNAPYQLAIIPQRILEQNARFGGKNFDDKPSDANLSTHKLRHGDVVIFVTDGVLDNVSPADCLRIVCEEMIRAGNWIVDRRSGDINALSNDLPYSGVETLAKRLVQTAFKASTDPKTDGPFAREAQRQMKVLYRGGKPDDITAVVMFVQQPIAPKPQEKL
ncbi:phosphatase 2C-like domain-containing protein [Limtongia smithiae]|uniref:phosphatase 2C-like domain-containing protein n=1 Tax=Limtongia smithiae TaxID=1125753 RepID=UPI0034CECB92